jgi:sulfur carrier protein ThiS
MNNESNFFASIVGTMKVNVGTPGNVRTVPLDQNRAWTVSEVLNLAEISPEGYDVRVNGTPASGTTPVTDGQTILLLAPVRGNLREVIVPPAAAETTAVVAPVPVVENIKVNVGTPGNVRPVSLAGDRQWSVGEVLNLAEVSSEGYDVRVNGTPANNLSPVTNGQTILLLAPVRGN